LPEPYISETITISSYQKINIGSIYSQYHIFPEPIHFPEPYISQNHIATHNRRTKVHDMHSKIIRWHHPSSQVGSYSWATK
jgi:hypothetical protein